jgi:hypothetical protein
VVCLKLATSRASVPFEDVGETRRGWVGSKQEQAVRDEDAATKQHNQLSAPET